MTSSKVESAEQFLANVIPAREVAADLGVSILTLYK